MIKFVAKVDRKIFKKGSRMSRYHNYVSMCHASETDKVVLNHPVMPEDLIVRVLYLFKSDGLRIDTDSHVQIAESSPLKIQDLLQLPAKWFNLVCEEYDHNSTENIYVLKVTDYRVMVGCRRPYVIDYDAVFPPT